MIRDKEELRRVMRCNASKSRRGSIDPPDVFLTMEDTLDTLSDDIDKVDSEALSKEELDKLTKE